MDPIPEVNDDAAGPGDVRPASAPTPTQGLAPVDSGPRVGETTRDGGSLPETESLLGAVMAGDPDGEALSLRRALELDDRPQTATPTRDEQLEQSAALRRAVTAEATTGPAAATDPTEQFEVHDAARGGDPLAQAIDETAVAQRAAQAQAERAEERDDVVLRQEHVPGATDRATQDAGAAAATQAGAGRPAAPRAVDEAEDEAEEQIERIEGLDRAQRIRAVRSRESD